MSGSGSRKGLAFALGFLLAALSTASASAHGFGQRYDLPVPLGLYIAGAGAAVALSFVVIGIFLRGTPGLRGYPRFNLLRWRLFPALVHPAPLFLVKLGSVLLLALVVLAGLLGNQRPIDNLAPTFVWVIWWVGTAYLSAFVGDVWALVNPWKAVYAGVQALYRWAEPDKELGWRLPYPTWLGAWPAFLLFLGFAWAELVYPASAIPLRLAQMVLAYSLITWGGMLLFGKEVWLRHGEAFSLVFGVLARFAPTEVRVRDPDVCHTCPIPCQDTQGECINCGDCFRRAPLHHRELNLRPLAAGLLRAEEVSPSFMALVLLMLATVTFDGFTATPVWVRALSEGFTLFGNLTLVSSLGLLAFPLAFLGVYLGFAAMTAVAGGSILPLGALARAFVLSLVPIALAYHLAHFFSFILIQGQLIIPLASDPFGFGWDLLGTAGYRIDIGVVDARAAWFTAVAAIVLGHIIAVYLAHIFALRLFPDRRWALRSQLPMLGLMVGYTMVSLWILAQPIVETTPRA